MEAPFHYIAQVYDVTFRLRYFCSFKLYMRPMKPETRERFLSRCRLGLRDLVVVMNGDVLDAAGMDIDLLTQCRSDHSGTLYMPAGESFTPRRIPAKFFICLPEYKISRIMFLNVHLHSCTFFETRKIDRTKLSIHRETRGIKKYTVFCAVCVYLFLQRLYHRYLTGNMIACSRKSHFVDFDIERSDIL